MSQKERKDAPEFLKTIRGQYIVGEALTIAIETLLKVDERNREESNIADMQYLLINIFSRKEAK